MFHTFTIPMVARNWIHSNVLQSICSKYLLSYSDWLYDIVTQWTQFGAGFPFSSDYLPSSPQYILLVCLMLCSRHVDTIELYPTLLVCATVVSFFNISILSLEYCLENWNMPLIFCLLNSSIFITKGLLDQLLFLNILHFGCLVILGFQKELFWKTTRPKEFCTIYSICIFSSLSNPCINIHVKKFLSITIIHSIYYKNPWHHCYTRQSSSEVSLLLGYRLSEELNFWL